MKNIKILILSENSLLAKKRLSNAVLLLETLGGKTTRYHHEEANIEINNKTILLFSFSIKNIHSHTCGLRVDFIISADDSIRKNNLYTYLIPAIWDNNHYLNKLIE